MVKCMVCDRNMKVINNFHLATHNLTVKGYKELFPNSNTFSDEIREKIGRATVKLHTGTKRSKETRKRQSEARKKGIGEGRIVTPFMTMDKTGENNPAWGNKYRSKEEIKETKEHLSKVMADRLLSGKHSSSYKNGIFLSLKNNKKFHYRSSYELRMFRILEELECVDYYDYECIRIPYVFNKINHTYIPDFLVKFKDGSYVLIEVGTFTFKLYKDSKTKCKHIAATELCSTRSIEFVVITNEGISKLEDTANRVNCWNDLKPFCHNVIGNNKRDGLKKKRICG